MPAASQRLLVAIERLLALPATDLRESLNRAAEIVSEALGAEKVDAFLYDAERSSLEAVGTGDSALSRLQIKSGLDWLPLANGGRAVEVFSTGVPYLNGNVEDDEGELLGIRKALGVRSEAQAPIDVAGQRRGVLAAATTKPQFFSEEDLRFVVTAARWIGEIVHRAELVREIESRAAREARRMAAEELVAVLAHDLRNYLSTIQGRVTLIHHRAVHETRTQDVRDAEIALRWVGSLGRFIDDLLDAERLEHGLFTLKPSPLDIATLVREVAIGVQSATVTFDVHAPARVMIVADEARVRQLLANVFSNAEKHSPKPGTVSITVHTETDDAGARHVFVDCSDQGAGIPPEILPHIFQRFVRSPASQGLGLGLYLAKRIALMHSGDLTADSAPGRGARFRLRLPAEPE